MAQCLCLSHSLPALQLKLDCYFPSRTVAVCGSECAWVSVCVCVCVTGSIRTLSAGLIGSNEFLCWGGWWRGLRGSCLAASPKTTPLKGFINTTFHCPIERGVCICVCVCGYKGVQLLHITYYQNNLLALLFPCQLSLLLMRDSRVKERSDNTGTLELTSPFHTHTHTHREIGALSQPHFQSISLIEECIHLFFRRSIQHFRQMSR